MWRNILIQVAYQVFILSIFIYFGCFIFFKQSFNIVLTPLRNEDGSPTDRLVLDTICFHTFILINLFNQINSRVVEQHDANVFKTLFNNFWFWLVFLFEIAIQQIMINASNSTLGSALLGTAPLATEQQMLCWVLGSLSLVVNIVSKQIPLQKFDFTRKINLETVDEKEPINKLVNMATDRYQRVNQRFENEDNCQ